MERGHPGRCLLNFAALLVVLTAAGMASNEPREYSHRIWRAQDGLPQNRIQAISQTPDGYLWIGTAGGLVRFDGTRFFVFDRSNTAAFRDDSILALCPSYDGSLWIGTEGGWLLHYDKGQFQALGPNEGLTNGFVRALDEDSRGTLWIGTDRGFFRMRGGKIERLDAVRDVPVASITDITEDRAGRIWAAGNLGLLVVEQDAAARFQPENPVLRGGVSRVRQARDGALLLLTQGGLRRMAGGKFAPVPGLERFTPLTVCEDHEGSLWVGTLGDGLVRIGPAGGIAFRDRGALPDSTVIAMSEDREGNLWIGTGDGLMRLSKTAVHTVSSRDGMADDNVSTIYEARDGALWLVTITGRIYRYAAGRLVPFRPPGSSAQKRFRMVYEDSKGALWFGTSTEGVLRLSGGKTSAFTISEGLRNNMVRQFYEDRRGDLWIALGSGLSRWDGRRFQNYYLEDGLSYGSVRVVTEDRDGDILIGTDGGLDRFHEGRFVRDEVFAQLNGERIWAIHQDAGGGIWVGTRGGGLFRIKERKVARLTVRDGLLSNSIYEVLEDGNGSLWMSSPAGVFSAPRSELDRVADGHAGPFAVVPYGTADGLESTQMNGGFGASGCRTASGELWFPSVRGAVRIDPNRVRLTHPSPVLIESITADEKAVPVSGDIVVPPGHGKLEIAYTACSLLSPERLTFRYRLEGFDPDWSPASHERAAHYTNLPPGHYRFLVSATDSATPRQSSEAALSVVWLPPFYRMDWFYALGATVLGLCVWAALRMKELLDQARVQVRLTLDEARQAVWDLRYGQLDGDIAGTLHNFARQLSAEKGIPIKVDLPGLLPSVDARTLRGILLVAREAIRNAANHGNPHHIRIQMAFEAGEARLEVVDDGRGFLPAAGSDEASGHYGIVGMRERVEQLGGIFLLRSSPGSGTAVVARLPLGRRRLRAQDLQSQS